MSPSLMVAPALWTDHMGRIWKVSTSRNKLKFNIPCHAAMRAYVMHRDGYKCCRCNATAAFVPPAYDGSFALPTNTRNGSGFRDQLVVDHVTTRAAGGRNVVENLQSLCETCNRKKIRSDISDAIAARIGVSA